MPFIANDDTPLPAVPGVDVVVVDYRTPQDLEGFLESYSECHGPDDRLHIALVQPTDRDRAVANRWREHFTFGSLTVFDDNVGYGRACNQAARAEAGQEPRDVIGFFNADTRLAPNILDYSASALRAHRDDQWAICGPRQVDDAGRLTHGGIRGTNRHPTMPWWKQPDTDLRWHGTEDDMVSVSGAAYFVKRDVWTELTACPIYRLWCFEHGLPDPDGAFLPTPLYYEEMWTSVHARSHGYKVAFLGRVSMVHRWHQAVAAAGQGEPTAKYHTARQMYRSACDCHGIDHE